MKAGEKQRTRRKHAGGPFVDLPVLKMDIACPSCGTRVELWTGGEETRCFACDHTIYKKPWISH